MKPAAIRLTRTGASSSARLAISAGTAAATVDYGPAADARVAGFGAHEQQRPSRPDPVDSVAGGFDGEQEVVAEGVAQLVDFISSRRP